MDYVTAVQITSLERRGAFRNRRRSVASLMVGNISYLTNPNHNPNRYACKSNLYQIF